MPGPDGLTGKVWLPNDQDYRDIDDYPLLKVKAPGSTRLVVRESILFGRVGEVAGLDLDLPVCANVEVTGVSGAARLDLNGESVVKIDLASTLTGTLTGVSKADAGRIDRADMVLDGAPSLSVDRLATGLLTASGSATVRIDGVRGDLDFQGKAAPVLRVGSAKGALSINLEGSGLVEVARADLQNVVVDVDGSGVVEIGGAAGAAQLSVSGTGGIRVEEVGALYGYQTGGASEIRIDRDPLVR